MDSNPVQGIKKFLKIPPPIPVGKITANEIELSLSRADYTKSCSLHGAYVPFLGKIMGGKIIVGPCPKCGAMALEQEKQNDLARIRTRLNESRVKDAQIPEIFWQKGFGEFQASSESVNKALCFAREFVDKFDDHRRRGTSAMLTGWCGTGKTHLACAILREILFAGKTGVYTTAMDMLRRIKDTFGKNSAEKERAAIAVFTEPDLLVIDEVGVQYGSDGGTNTDLVIFSELIDKRTWSNKPTIMASNLALSEIETWIGERVVSRLTKYGGAVLAMTGQDYRKVKTS